MMTFISHKKGKALYTLKAHTFIGEVSLVNGGLKAAWGYPYLIYKAEEIKW